MILRKWNYEKKEYEPYEIPAHWFPSLFETDMDAEVTCPQCGKKIRFGDGYTSREIHNAFGMGYAVCRSCYDEELDRDVKYRGSAR